MFSDHEVDEFIEEEFGGEIWGETVNHSHLIDPPMEWSGPKLHEEIDMQEWQKLVQLSTPMSEIHDYAEPTCLRVKRVDTGLGRFYYKAGYYNSWGDADLKEMSEEPAPEIPCGVAPKVETLEETPEVEQEPEVVAEPEVVTEADVKTRMQITLKRQSRNVRGHTGNFVVHGVRATAMIELLSVLTETYPKTRRPAQTVRIQFTEYRMNSGSYRPERGGNMNLHNAEVGTVLAFISTKLVNSRFALRGREWVREEQTTQRGVDNTRQRLSEVRKIIDQLPSAIDTVNVPYDREVHEGLWCLCRIRKGQSWVLSADKDLRKIHNAQAGNPSFTYILNPTGSIHKEQRT